jgi:membrane associated rhomboid family serine protease
MNAFPISITNILIAINVILFFITESNKLFLAKTIMWPYYVKRNNELYRFVTSGFLHANFMHLFFNMFTLYFFGNNIEMIFKMNEMGNGTTFLILYFGAIIVSDVPSYFKNKDVFEYRSLGASGAVSAVVFATILFSPWSSIYLYAYIKISATVYAVLFIAYCIYMGKKAEDNINHDAHLWGAIFGLSFTLLIVYVMRPDLIGYILEQLKHPSLFGRN